MIGINAYNDPAWNSLEYAVNDAKRVAKMLRENLGFDGVIGVLGKDATREGILTALGSELRRFAGEDDLVFIYFSGHGSTQKLIEGKMGYIIPVEGKKAVPFETGISMKTFRDTRNLIHSKLCMQLMPVTPALSV